MFEKFQQKFSEPTGDAEVNDAKDQFLDLMQQLRDAYENGDTDTAQSKTNYMNSNSHFSI